MPNDLSAAGNPLPSDRTLEGLSSAACLGRKDEG